MKVTGTFQTTSNLSPCPPLPVLHTPARKVKADTKHREWRVNPMARVKLQQQLGMVKVSQKYPMARVTPQQHPVERVTPQQHPMDRVTPQQDHNSRSISSLPHKSNKFGKGSASAQGNNTEGHNGERQNIDPTQRLQFLTSSNQQNTQRTTLGKHKFDGIRKTQYLSINNKFSNLTMALNTAYKKSQEQADKRLKIEKTLQDKPSQVMSC